jgi:hypothetical protein
MQGRKIIILLSIFTFIFLLAFPPYLATDYRGVIHNMGYAWILSPPSFSEKIIASVNISLLLTEIAIALIITILAIFFTIVVRPQPSENGKIEQPKENQKYTYHNVSTRRRLLAFLIDLVPIMILNSLIFGIVKSAGLKPDSFLDYWSAGALSLIAYYLPLEYFFNSSLGKAFLGIKIKSTDQSKNKFEQTIIRNLSKLIPFDGLSILPSQKNEFWHDSISKTEAVIKKRI